MTTPTTLRDHPAITLQSIVDVMYGDGPDQPWDAETIERVAEVLQAAGLVPTEGTALTPPSSPPSNG